MVEIEPSLLAADFACLEVQARQAVAAGVKVLQIDVADGRFVPAITFGPDTVRALCRLLPVKLDVHLMVVEPERHIGAFAEAGAWRLIVHQEACLHLHAVLQAIRELGVQAGVTLNPGTPLCMVEEVLDIVDAVQVMTVNPGAGGQPLIPSQLDKIRRLRAVLDQRGLPVPVLADGGLDRQTAPLAARAGATVLVMGSSVFNEHGTLVENLAALRAGLQGV